MSIGRVLMRCIFGVIGLTVAALVFSAARGASADAADALARRGARQAAPSAPSRSSEHAAVAYADLITLAAREQGVDPELVSAIIKAESNYDRHAISRKGAQGLMQLMPDTADRYGVRDPFDPEANIRGGVRYLRFLQELFPGRLSWALAAYNAGENAVLRHNGVPPYRETRQYVDRVLAHYGQRDTNFLAIQRPHPPAAPEEAQGLPSAPMLFRVESHEVVLYTNVSPARRPAPRSVQ